MWRTLFIAAGLAAAVSGQALAGFIGQTVTPTYQTPGLGTVYASSSWSPAIFVVGAGQDTAGNIEGVTDLLVDFSDNTLTITLKTVLPSPTWNTVAFNGPVFTSLAAFGIATAHVDATTTMAGFDNSRISSNSTDIAVDWNGLSYVDGTRVQIDFTFNPIPEPVSMALFGLGLSGLAVSRRRRRAASAAAEASVLRTRVGITESSYAPTTIHVVIPAKAGTQLRAWVPAFAGMTTRGTKRHRQMKHLFRLRP